MDGMLQSQLHYRAAIDLQSNTTARDNWKDLVKRIRSWTAKVAGGDETDLARRWFYVGGHWTQGCPRGASVETRSAIPDEGSGRPAHWACRIEHPCREHPQCLWRTDVTLTTVSDDRFRLVVLNQRAERPEYVGEEPPPPAPSVPGLIKALLRAQDWRCMAGTVPLSPEPVCARVGYLDLLKRSLEDPDRRCPLVYVTRDPQSGDPLVDEVSLAAALMGTAVVYVAESSEADEETEAIFPRTYRCWGGMVRIYQPRVRFDDERDYRRHRFFEPERIRSIGPDGVELQIVQACCRRAYLLNPGDVASIDDVGARDRMHQLSVRARQGVHQDKELDKLIQSVQDDNAKFMVENDHLRQEIEEKDDQLRRNRHEYDAYKQATHDTAQRCADLQKQVAAISELKQLPTSLQEALDLVGRLHAGRVVVLPEALTSAKAASLDPKYLPEAWRLLWSVADDLYDLYFDDEQGKDMEQAYRDRTGFTLSLNEGSETKKRKRLMKLRTRVYDGRDIDITAHVKWGNQPPKCLRVHYALDKSTSRIIIGHCGDHVENYTSSTRK